MTLREAQAKVDARSNVKPIGKPLDHTALSMRALMGKTFAPTHWTVNGYIPEGTVLVAGRPKSGKSWFALNLLLASALGVPFLRGDVTKTGGLYLALEDNERRMQRRMQTLMRHYPDRGDELDAIEVRFDWPPGAIGAELLNGYLESKPSVRVVVVDVLKNIRPRGNDRTRNAYDLDYEAIEPWKQVAQERRITLVVVHHTRKGEAEDVFDEISGTLGLNGVVDEMIVLKPVPGDKHAATLHMRGRDLEEDVELGVELREGWWEVVGTANELTLNDARRAILDVLGEEERPMTVGELLKATGKKSRPSLSKLLRKMLEDRELVTIGKAYALPPSL